MSHMRGGRASETAAPWPKAVESRGSSGYCLMVVLACYVPSCVVREVHFTGAGVGMRRHLSRLTLVGLAV
jgi:hypothetical protein